MHVKMGKSSGQKSFIELFGGRISYTMGASLAVQSGEAGSDGRYFLVWHGRALAVLRRQSYVARR